MATIELIETIENFPVYALPYLTTGDDTGLEYSEAKAVDDLRERLEADCDSVTFDAAAPVGRWSQEPLFGLPCNVTEVYVWGVPRHAVPE